MYWYPFLKINTLYENQKIKLNNEVYVIKGGILRQKSIYSNNQKQTLNAFGFKWNKRNTYESDLVKENSRKED